MACESQTQVTRRFAGAVAQGMWEGRRDRRKGAKPQTSPAPHPTAAAAGAQGPCGWAERLNTLSPLRTAAVLNHQKTE